MTPGDWMVLTLAIVATAIGFTGGWLWGSETLPKTGIALAVAGTVMYFLVLLFGLGLA